MNMLVATTVCALFLAQGQGAAEERRSDGKAEYFNSCAVCHGRDGRGHGPMAEQLIKPPADLTRLSERNGGTFPYSRVFAIIDGRYIVPGHGDREMPIWGRRFTDENVKSLGETGGEIVATERVHELTGYVESLQR